MSDRTFSLVTQLVVMLPQFGDQLSTLQLDLWVGGQVVSGRMLLNHSVGLDVQVPVDTEDGGGGQCRASFRVLK